MIDQASVIAQAAAQLVGLSLKELASRKRGQHVAYQRHEWCWYMRKVAGLSFPGIGERINRHHASIMNSYDRMEAKFKNGWKARLSQNLEILRALGSPNDALADFNPIPESETMRVGELIALYEQRRAIYRQKLNVCEAALDELQGAVNKLRAA